MPKHELKEDLVGRAVYPVPNIPNAWPLPKDPAALIVAAWVEDGTIKVSIRGKESGRVKDAWLQCLSLGTVKNPTDY